MLSTSWGVSTDAGSSLSADELDGVLTAHHDRVIAGWASLSPEQWDQPSRNAQWTCHDTARHVADVLELAAAEMTGSPARFSIAGFDPRVTPDAWMAASVDDPPARTIERFAGSAPLVRDRVGDRLAAGDDSTGMTVYGPAHWSVNVVHIFWDSWLHERDVLIPLGMPADSTPDEQRLASLYALVMAMVPTKMMELDSTAAIEFTASQNHVIVAGQESGRIWGVETPDAEAALSGEVCSLVDALSGRGEPLRELLPDAPDTLCFFADYMSG